MLAQQQTAPHGRWGLAGCQQAESHARRRPTYHQLAQLALIPLVLLLGPRLAGATIFVISDKAPLVRRADAIALGTIRAVTPRWEARRIVSDIELDVEQTVKGSLPGRVSLVAAGGKVGDVVMRVIDGAEFHVGDRSIVFMSARDGVRRPLGLAAGKLDVRTRDGSDVVAWRKESAVEEVPLTRVIAELRRLVQERVP